MVGVVAPYRLMLQRPSPLVALQVGLALNYIVALPAQLGWTLKDFAQALPTAAQRAHAERRRRQLRPCWVGLSRA
jgi:hypothetical protein